MAHIQNTVIRIGWNIGRLVSKDIIPSQKEPLPLIVTNVFRTKVPSNRGNKHTIAIVGIVMIAVGRKPISGQVISAIGFKMFVVHLKKSYDIFFEVGVLWLEIKFKRAAFDTGVIKSDTGRDPIVFVELNSPLKKDLLGLRILSILYKSKL